MWKEKLESWMGIHRDAQVHDKTMLDQIKREKKDSFKKSEIADLMGMSYRRFSSLLPYRYYDNEDQLFINESSIGFALELAPLTGASEDITKAISEMIKNKLSPEWVTQVMLMGCNRVDHQIKHLTHSTNDPVFDKLRLNQYQFFTTAAKQGFPNRRKVDLPCRDYRIFMFVSKKSTYNEREAALCTDLRSDIMMELKNAMISSAILDTRAFLVLLKTLINQDQSTSYPDCAIDQYKELNEQVIDPNWRLRVEDTHLEVSLIDDASFEVIDEKKEKNEIKEKKETKEIKNKTIEEIGKNTRKTVITSLSLKQLPTEAILGSMADNFANIVKNNMGIPCNFVISMHFKTNDQEVSKRTAFTKERGLEKKAHSPYAKYVPGVIRAAAEWKRIRTDLDSDDISLVRMYYNVTLFSNPWKVKQDISKTISAFRVNGMDLYTIQYQQLQSYLSMLPFVVAEGLWLDLASLGRINKITSWNLSNMLPLVADYKGEISGQGLVAPTFRHQMALIDLFSPNAQNHNCCIAATSGSGKSVIAQSIIASVLADGGKVFVIDMGNSYKKFCETLGGTYMDVSNLQLNPFSHVPTISDSAESIRDLLAIMAAPNSGISDIQKSHLLEAVHLAFEKHKHKTIIDHVVHELLIFADNTQDQRVRDLATLLKSFTTTADSISARIFNQPSMLGSDDKNKERFIVLELGGLNDQPDLLKSVLFALILNIEQAMYHSDRLRKKLCVIDEAWSLLSGGNETAARAIEKGYRTARRHRGAWMAITQSINDFYASSEAKAAYNNSDNKIIMRQDPKSFQTFLQENENHFSAYEAQLISQFKPSNVTGYSEFLFQQGSNSTFHRLMLDPVSKILYSSKAQEYQFVKNRMDQGVPVHQAIMEGAHAFYGDEMQTIQAHVNHAA